ncbi:hypothetical protein ABH975_000181 [Bradyrhizobium ottawaense]|uniref:hypothetical protein n=1 Tax=Bradyrhizobium ottawaense TaxID=931866 RepID=UPI0035168F37
MAGGSCDFGVVITTGDEFTVQTTGLTIFQNKKTVVPIPGWGLSDLIFARTRAAIPAGASVLRITYNPAKFPPHDESKDTLKDRLVRDPNAELAGYMREAVKGTNCRHYIQILNAISPIGSSSYTVRGFGILNQDVVLGRRIFLHALAFIRIFDGRGLCHRQTELCADQPGSFAGGAEVFGQARRRPLSRVARRIVSNAP